MNDQFIIKSNPNESAFKEISDAVRANGNYCCCAIFKNEDTMCICKEFRDSQESGFCHCGRFYKVKEYSTVAVLCSPDDSDYAESLAESLTKQGFIVLTPRYGDLMSYLTMSNFYNEMQKAKIHKADIVLVVNSSTEAMEFLEEQILWAEELQKKIIYEHNEEIKDDEN